MHEIERDWITKAGLRAICLIANGSHRCGYVEVQKDSPLFGVEYREETDALQFDPAGMMLGKRGILLVFTASCGASDGFIRRSPDVAFDVHGSLTFSGAGADGYPVNSDGWWFGFDCAHSGDGSLDPSRPLWMDGEIRDEEYVVAECESLAQQIVDMTNNGQ